MISWKEEFNSPFKILFVGLLALFCLIELIHLEKHQQYCKTEAQWMLDKQMQGLDNESPAE